MDQLKICIELTKICPNKFLYHKAYNSEVKILLQWEMLVLYDADYPLNDITRGVQHSVKSCTSFLDITKSIRLKFSKLGNLSGNRGLLTANRLIG